MSNPVFQKYTQILAYHYLYLAKRYRYKRNCRAFSKLIKKEFYVELTKEELNEIEN